MEVKFHLVAANKKLLFSYYQSSPLGYASFSFIMDLF